MTENCAIQKYIMEDTLDPQEVVTHEHVEWLGARAAGDKIWIFARVNVSMSEAKRTLQASAEGEAPYNGQFIGMTHSAFYGARFVFDVTRFE